eukprot:CAMPEP_0182939388 /NCGR_PEP_ID=MMETSP0105_2-20130417/45536_1 /TAXON_ID=81532 ORGANISM="Acanthoeca-like sp., Strain 10tr" /NCGR_SAMPLE_ID=MMETSP0105_2 /ASSEMBLY_ACC=CAM_ASM_000205 /LENGTH=194 /DNA_ID=CAMNT_0025078775 /DNA_START=135 /DNA_END=716 /DNA_ORIENTATION=+
MIDDGGVLGVDTTPSPATCSEQVPTVELAVLAPYRTDATVTRPVTLRRPPSVDPLQSMATTRALAGLQLWGPGGDPWAQLVGEMASPRKLSKCTTELYITGLPSSRKTAIVVVLADRSRAAPSAVVLPSKCTARRPLLSTAIVGVTPPATTVKLAVEPDSREVGHDVTRDAMGSMPKSAALRTMSAPAKGAALV